MLRSVLEKTLKKHGYVRDGNQLCNLYEKIEAACNDGVIAAALRNRAHAQIRVLGNDILHEDYRVVDNGQFDDAHHYTQRILEGFYDDPDEVRDLLVAAGRLNDDGDNEEQAAPAGPEEAEGDDRD